MYESDPPYVYIFPQFRAHWPLPCPLYSIPGTAPAASMTGIRSRLLFGSSLPPKMAHGPRPNEASRRIRLFTGDVQMACAIRIGLSLPPSASGDSDPIVNGDANDTPPLPSHR